MQIKAFDNFLSERQKLQSVYSRNFASQIDVIKFIQQEQIKRAMASVNVNTLSIKATKELISQSMSLDANIINRLLNSLPDVDYELYANNIQTMRKARGLTQVSATKTKSVVVGKSIQANQTLAREILKDNNYTISTILNNVGEDFKGSKALSLAIDKSGISKNKVALFSEIHTDITQDGSVSKISEQLNEEMVYYGDENENNRDFCARYVGEVLKYSEWQEIDKQIWSGKCASLFDTGGGYNCIHALLPYRGFR